MGRSQTRREARIDRMLDVAMVQIAHVGIGGFSLHKLAAELDLTVGALYRYFPHKMALLAAREYRVIHAIDRDRRKAGPRVDPVQQDTDDPQAAIARLLHISQAYRQSLRAHPERMMLIGHILSTPGNILEPEVAIEVMQALVQALSVASEALTTASTHACISGANQTHRAIILWATMQGLIQLEKLQRHDADHFKPMVLFNTAIDALLVGWGCPESLLKDARRHLAQQQEKCDD
ncbi:MAG: helix-turn-helix domain-containing protein [Myxococcota bacterium]|nr:helix-turn-helix domain-containing protein [Myxococcota bacterium]